MKTFTKLIGLWLAFLLSIIGTVDAQMVMSRQARTLTTSNSDIFYAYEYTPQGYNPSGTILHPLIIFLHGIGERSNSINDLPSLENLGLPLVIKDGSTMTFNWNGNTESFVVMAPMSRETSTINTDLSRFHPEYIQATIDYAINNLKVDPDRIYLTGLSYGGGGTLNYISLDPNYTQRIAAAAPVSSPAHFRSNGPTYVKNANLPLWAFVGALDNLTPPIHSENVVNGINALNPPVRARLSIIPNGAHDWVTYNAVYYHLNHPNGVYENPISLYEWFLGQDKSLAANVLPVANAGADQNITTSPGSTVLNGSGSTDADGIVRYLWRQISGPKTITITNTYTSSISAAAAHATKSISGLTIAGTYRFELTVVDVRAGISKDTVDINVTSAPNSGNAVTMTAASGRIQTGDVTELVNASKFTLEAMIKYDEVNPYWTNIVRKNIDGNQQNRIMFHVGPGDNALYVLVNNGGHTQAKTAVNAVSPGTWYHVAAVFDGTQTGNANRLKIYINGVQQTLTFTGTIPATTSSINTAPFIAGGDPICCNIGNIDEVRVWNTALSTSTINDWKDKLLGSCHPNIANLVVYWPLNNSTNPAVATAELGTAYTGTITNANYISTTVVTDTVPCPGKAVTMTAASGRIQTGDVTELVNASKFTLEAMIKYDVVNPYWTNIVRKNIDGNQQNRIMFHVGPGDNALYVLVNNGGHTQAKTAVNAVSPGTWYHVAAVFDGTQTGNANRLKIYIDGVQQTLTFTGTIPATTSSINTAPFIAGGDPICCNIGNIDEVRVWNTALSTSTINDWKDKLLGSCHPDIANLVVYWPLNNSTNPAVATAELGTAYTGTITNANYISTTVAADTVPCPDKAVSMTAASGRIQTGDVTELVNASKFTLEAMIKYDVVNPYWTNIVRKNIDGNQQNRIMFHVGPGDNALYVLVNNGSHTQAKTAVNAVSPGTWYHVAAVFDGTLTGNANRLKIYIDGVQQTLTFTGTIPATTSSINTAPFIAGGDPICCNIGNIDEVRVWNTALSTSTINDWKDKLLGSCHPDIANLVVYWPLNNSTNPAVATAELGTAYTGTITNANYVISNQTTTSSDCVGARVTPLPSLEKVEENKLFTGKIYPNPTEGFVQIELNASVSKSVTVDVLNMSGKYLSRNRSLLVKGNNRISLNIASLPSGTYIIVIGDGKTIHEKYKVLKR